MSVLEKRFGLIAVEMGLITIDQLHKALIVQVKENIEGNTHKIIGKILIDLGYISEDQANKISENIKLHEL